MKLVFLLVAMLGVSCLGYTQEVVQDSLQPNTHAIKPFKNGRKGEMYIYWGWNIGWYSNSNITFTGDKFDFKLDNVIANDRQSKFDLGLYLNPATMTIPQYNFRIGYFIKDHYNISFGIDHMKYVMLQDQTVKITGTIDEPDSPYNGVYDNEDIVLVEDFLTFEHTDGLNYANVEFRRFDEIVDWNKVKIHLTEGLGAGMLIPRTNTMILGHERYDEFHLSGYGIHAVIGVNVTFFKHFFIQSEFKGGFMHMPDVRITAIESDKAKQSFFFSQLNIVFGGSYNFNKDNR